MTNRAILSCDQGYYKGICPACDKPVVWKPVPGGPGKDYRAEHNACGLQFGLMTRTYEVWVADEHGNEVGADLAPIESQAPPPVEKPESYEGELQPDGTILIRVPGDPR